MRRREFITLLGGAAAWPIAAANAQQSDRVRRIGVLMGYAESDPVMLARLAIVRRGLQELGWIEGRNLRIDARFAADDPQRVQAHVTELVGLMPDLIFAQSTPVLSALQRATRSIPVVFVQVSDPVSTGFVASLSHPGGNFTGFTAYENTMGAKWLEALKEIAPGTARVAIMQNPDYPSSGTYFPGLAAAAPLIGVQLIRADARNAADVEGAITTFASEPGGGLIALPDLTMFTHRELIFALAARYRLPAMFAVRNYPVEGGLMSYGVDIDDLYRRSTTYVDRILRGAKPDELPVQMPAKYELVVNLKTAKALGLTVPPTLLARADEVIE